MLQYSICAFLAPALVSAAAFAWTGPEPTLVVPEQDTWSPAVTDAPELGLIELFKRDEDNTCGFVSGDPSKSLTCNNASYICATNTYYGVHGCCNPASISQCSIPTTCIPSSALAASCTGTCSSNSYVAKCTDSNQPFCYQWRYVYPSTIMTEYGCASSAFTLSVQRYSSSDGVATTISPASSSSTSSSSTPSTSSSSTVTGPNSANTSPASPSQSKTPTPIGAIVGGVVGGVAVLGAIVAGIIFIVLRSRKQKQNDANAAFGASQPFIAGGGQGPAPGVTEYKPQSGFPTPSPSPYDSGTSGYFTQQSLYSPVTSPGLQQGAPLNPVEAGGNEVPGGTGNVKMAQIGTVYEAPT